MTHIESPYVNVKTATQYIFGQDIKPYSYKAVLRWMKSKKLKSGKRGKERVTTIEWIQQFIVTCK